MKFRTIVPTLCLLSVFASCESYNNQLESKTTGKREIVQEGQYRLVLTPVNPTVAGDATGTAEININADKFEIVVNVDGAPHAAHAQYIYSGQTCPDAREDTNGDEIIDAAEARAVSFEAIVPLDSDLRSQAADGIFPEGMNYDYKQTTSLSALLADLRPEKLELEGQVVIVHGLPSATVLPETVQGPHETIPILCGLIEKMDLGATTDSTGL